MIGLKSFDIVYVLDNYIKKSNIHAYIHRYIQISCCKCELRTVNKLSINLSLIY